MLYILLEIPLCLCVVVCACICCHIFLFVLLSSFREKNVMEKTFVPSAATGPMTGGRSNGVALTPLWKSLACLTAPLDPRMCLCAMMSAPSTAPAALRARATMDAPTVTETLLPARPPLRWPIPAQQMTRTPAGAPPAVPQQTRCCARTLLSANPPHLVEVVEDRTL